MKKNKKSGFVLAYTVIVMGVVFVVMAVLVAYLSGLSVKSKTAISNFEKDMFISQQEYNYNNLGFDDYSNYLKQEALKYDCIEDTIQYYFERYIIVLNNYYTHLIVYNVDKSLIFLEIHN